LRVSAYIIGSSVSGEYCRGYSDLDLTVFCDKVKYPMFKVEHANGFRISISILPYPVNGLVLEMGFNLPSLLGTKMFLTSPRKHVFGERIEKYLKYPREVDFVDFLEWCNKRIDGASLGLDRKEYRRVLKNYVKAVWACYACENMEPKTFTWRTMVDTLQKHKPEVLPEKYVSECLNACRLLYSCRSISEDVAEHYWELTLELCLKAPSMYKGKLKKIIDERLL